MKIVEGKMEESPGISKGYSGDLTKKMLSCSAQYAGQLLRKK